MNPFVGLTKNPRFQHSPKESRFVWKVWQRLKMLEPSCWIKIHGSAYGEAGIPDIIGCYNGRFVAVELKREDGKGVISKKQEYWIERIREKGGASAVISSMEEIDAFIKQLEDGDI